ncbi:hypothetical protein A2871_02325 [Candidatus Daviesbacteria bacterium RIFCSPHIGHO2_01_FULL_41_23]|uniref:Uncharacterized protein n=1 Tax=Candidatus Daviesbacteria bacterium RIFCSPHIGHO2_01_FULL_41_23 TaxID=1797764 RepID=A0A1F5ITZ3_9BACT|nr:MAG: hypothetical protein A2871_02325 [Candidatus Daviesbacteria bacterium RIFCSPHIGHO2_01_FULL_41_23]
MEIGGVLKKIVPGSEKAPKTPVTTEQSAETRPDSSPNHTPTLEEPGILGNWLKGEYPSQK